MNEPHRINTPTKEYASRLRAHFDDAERSLRDLKGAAAAVLVRLRRAPLDPEHKAAAARLVALDDEGCRLSKARREHDASYRLKDFPPLTSSESFIDDGRSTPLLTPPVESAGAVPFDDLKPEKEDDQPW